MSSFIELFAAIYLTITLDDLLLKRFWTPDYTSEMEKAFADIKLPNVTKNDVLKKSREISSVEDVRSRRRGCVIFCFSVLMLVFIGFEDKILYNSSTIEGTSLVLFTLFTTGAYIFDEIFLKSSYRLVAFIIISPILALGCAYGISKCRVLDVWIQEFSGWTIMVNIVVVLSLILPVVWQIIRNRVYTSYYLQYIIFVITKKAADYNYAVNYDHSKGHKMSKVAAPYMNIVADTMASGDSDRTITPYHNVLNDELSQIDYLPSFSNLITCSRLIHKRFNPTKNKLKRLDRQYNTSNRISLEEFCEQKNIDLKVFKNFRNQINGNQ